MFPRSLFMFLCLQMRPYPILGCFEHLRSQEAPPNFGPNTKNRWFFGITFNATVRSPNMWYECNFFNAKQIPHQIYEKSMIHYGGADGGAPCTWWYTSKLNFYVKIETMCLLFLVESLFNHQTSAPPPIRPPMIRATKCQNMTCDHQPESKIMFPR